MSAITIPYQEVQSVTMLCLNQDCTGKADVSKLDQEITRLDKIRTEHDSCLVHDQVASNVRKDTTLVSE